MNKRVLISLLIITALCFCCSLSILAGIFVLSPTIQQPGVKSTDPAGKNTQPVDTPVPSEHSEAESSNLPPELTSQMDEIQQQVITIRGLQAHKPVTRDLLNTTELKQKVETDFFKDYTAQDAHNDELLLATLGMIPDGFDLMDLYHRLYAEQIAGYYDSDTKEMYVVEGKGFGGVERMTYAHEYTHTLQDQNYDLKEGLKLDQKYCKTESEYCSAASALLEGDATYTEQEWLIADSSKQDKKDVEDFYAVYSSPVFDSAPAYLQEDFLFPYKKGLEFVYSLHDLGGYTAINQALKNPPVTTEQILHPDKYPAEKPLPVTLPDLISVLPQGWTKISTSELGEWYTYLIFARGQDQKYQLLDSIAKKASAGWGGDQYALYSDPQNGKTTFVLHSKWDTNTDADEYYQALKEYSQERWGKASHTAEKSQGWTDTKEGRVLIKQTGQDTLWLISPDPDIEKAIVSVLPEFA
jgi:hypothetical protein